MTKQHNHKLGGKGRAAIDRPPKPKLGRLILACDGCGCEYLTTINVGKFDIYQVCDCGAVIHVTGHYDGYAADLSGGTIEEVTK